MIIVCVPGLHCSLDQETTGGLSGPSGVSGTYSLVSAHDKTGTTFGRSGITIPADEPTVIQGNGASAMFLITGSLTFTANRYSVKISMNFVGSGGTQQSLTRTDDGTYKILGTSIRLMSDIPEIGTESGTVSQGGTQVSIDTRDIFFVFEKM
ncbi:MAG: hypothetical protein IH853_12215 [Bacteroidetes bacterium]|nr:hypothetical protein [Bacteroidota bacterium]